MKEQLLLYGETMNDISVKALAKINLGLDVIRRREDGYHEVRMIMQTIHLYDKLEIKKTTESGIAIASNISLCSLTAVIVLPVDRREDSRALFS